MQNNESLRDKVFDTGIDAIKTGVAVFDPTGVSGKILENVVIKARQVELEKRWRAFLLGLSKDINEGNKDSVEEKLLKFSTDEKLSSFIHSITEELRSTKTSDMAPIIKGILAGKYLSDPDSFDETDKGILSMIGHFEEDDFEWFDEFFTLVLNAPSNNGESDENYIIFFDDSFMVDNRKNDPQVVVNLETMTCGDGEYNSGGLPIPSLDVNYVWRDFVEKIKKSGFFRVATSFGPDNSFKQNGRTTVTHSMNPSGTLLTKLDLICEREGLKRILELIKIAKIGKEKLNSGHEAH